MKVDNNQVAIINLQDLHDIVAGGDLATLYEDGMAINKFVLEDDSNPVAVEIVNELNAIREKLSDLDCRFHDEFEDQYC